MTIYNLKSRFQKLLRPLISALIKCGITANQVTLLALGLSIFWGLFILVWSDKSWPLIFLPLILFVRMALNAIDGMMAREYKMASSLGAILNELSDVISDAALYLPFALLSSHFAWPVTLLVVSGIIAEMTGIIGVQIGASRRYDGPLGKSDRAFVFGVVGLLTGFNLIQQFWISLIFWAAVVLSAVTIYNRGRKALNELNS